MKRAVAAWRRRPGRRDIQGLRALAVVAVILDHSLDWPRGGFVGVDIFFVISGFLITDLLLREHARTGHISFKRFYLRRAKRILPAAIPVLVATVALSAVIFSSRRHMTVVWDGVWSLFFAANWRFAATETNYFEQGGPISPLQHFWSLAVEEQFYVVWPWLLLGLLAVASRRGSRRMARTLAGITIGLISIASFGWAMRETTLAPTLAYFSTVSRAWELGVGACLAVAAPLCKRIPSGLRPVFGWTGLAGIVVSLLITSESNGFPAPGAALPVLATAAVIAAGTGVDQQRFMSPLTNPVASYLGDISYSLYLWHFPIVILLQTQVDRAGWTYGVLAAVLMLSISVCSYHLIENPIRSGQIRLERGRKRRHGGRRRLHLRLEVSQAYRYGVTALICAISLGFVAAAAWPSRLQPGATAMVAPQSQPSAGSSTKGKTDYGPRVTTLQKEITAALTQTSWPDLSPTLDSVIESDESLPKVNGCADQALPDPDYCVWGPSDAKKTAVLMGDSLSANWVAPLAETYGEGDWNLEFVSLFGCPYTDFLKKHTDGQAAKCDQKKAAAVTHVNEQEPDLIFIANTSVLPELNRAGKEASASEWGQGLQTFIEKMPESSTTVVLAAPPADKDVKDCYTRSSVPGDCVSYLLPQWWAVHNAETAAAKQAGAVHVDTRPLFCTEDGLCPPFVGRQPTKRDVAHIAFDYSKTIEPGLRELLDEADVET